MTNEDTPTGPPFTVERYGSLGESIMGERDWLRLEVERLNRKCAALALLHYGPNPNAAEPSEGRSVKPHRSGGQPVAPAFRDERLHRIDKLMDAQSGTPEGAELDTLVDEQVNAEKSGAGE